MYIFVYKNLYAFMYLDGMPLTLKSVKRSWTLSLGNPMT